MKLMKHITIAMVLCAIPAMAFGQAGAAEPVKVAVAGCEGGGCYTVPYFKGDVGVVVKAMGDVAWVSTCGPVTMSDTMMMATEEEPGGHMKGDVLVMSFMDGMGCHADKGGSLTIHGADSGGWYWVNGMNNSAVSTLLPYELMGTGEEMMPALPDGTMHTSMDDATMVMGGPGLIGIIPHHNAMAPMPDPAMCGGNMVTQDCMIHASNALMMMIPGQKDTTGYGTTTKDVMVPDGSVISRNAASNMTVDVGVMGSGYIGMLGETKAGSGMYTGSGYLMSDIKAMIMGGAMGDMPVTDQLGSPGGVRIAAAQPMAGRRLRLTILGGTRPGAKNYCGPMNNHSVTVKITADVTEAGLIPSAMGGKMVGGAKNTAKASLTVTCGK